MSWSFAFFDWKTRFFMQSRTSSNSTQNLRNLFSSDFMKHSVFRFWDAGLQLYYFCVLLLLVRAYWCFCGDFFFPFLYLNIIAAVSSLEEDRAFGNLSYFPDMFWLGTWVLEASVELLCSVEFTQDVKILFGNKNSINPLGRDGEA